MHFKLFVILITFSLNAINVYAHEALIIKSIQEFEEVTLQKNHMLAHTAESDDAALARDVEISPAYDPAYIPVPIDTEITTQHDASIDNDQAVIEDALPVIYGNLWNRVIDGFMMPTVVNSAYIKAYEKSYSRNPQKFREITQRSEKYLFHILKEIDKRNMPAEIALLPIIESAYKPNALSHSKALGIWQIIPSTGRYFGLKQNWWIDDRKSIANATEVALNYLEKLHQRFGKWDLALAAYNAGGGTVGRAIKKNKSLGKPTGYRYLDLPRETRKYVPKLQAVKNIILNPHRYGVDIPSIEDKPYFTTVTAPNQIDTDLVAKLAEISEEEFKALNPNFKRPVIASTGSAQLLLLPIHAVDTFEYNLAVYDQPLVNWQSYTIKRGGTLASAARKFNISLKSLSKINQLPPNVKVRKSLTILVPNHQRVESSDNQTNNTYTEADIARKQTAKNIQLSALKTLQNNRLPLNKASRKRYSKRRITYVVKRGDTLIRIAARHRVSVKSIVASNHIKHNRIKIGQKLKINRGSKSKKMRRKKKLRKVTRKQ